MEPSPYTERIADLAEQARAARASFEPPESPPAEEQALEYLREVFGPAVTLYIDARTGADHVRLTSEDFSRLDQALHDGLTLYLRCYGSEHDPDVTVRTAAELLVETHNIRDTAQLLTDVPSRR
ncbi:hypothetical protein [Halobellus marinus]|jgi:hypothetical protein|uniref:hypothetical protein n=1 Tax=Halobellus TaxID=1073986 RepID=UPI0028AE145A|nr:hypothetical protein [Halobellus sp. DFY28]